MLHDVAVGAGFAEGTVTLGVIIAGVELNGAEGIAELD